jgi:F-type H+-transporting ATPase subunit a
LPEQGARKVIVVAQADGGHGAAGAATETHAAAGHEAGGHGGGHGDNPLAHHTSSYFTGVAALVIGIILVVVLVCRSRGLQKRNPSKRQSLLEQGVESMAVFCERAIGPGGGKWTPLVATVFTFVLVSNLMGVLPTVFARSGENQVSHLLPAPTANLSMTIALALVVFVVVQYAGIKANGFGGWLKHFAGPIPALAPLMFPLELIGALAKPLSLSIRLFGNVFGEETVIAVLVSLAAATLPLFLPIPFQFPMLMFGVFGSLVQAGVFTILTCAYISLSVGEHEHHADGHDEHVVEDEFGAPVPAH